MAGSLDQVFLTADERAWLAEEAERRQSGRRDQAVPDLARVAWVVHQLLHLTEEGPIPTHEQLRDAVRRQLLEDTFCGNCGDTAVAQDLDLQLALETDLAVVVLQRRLHGVASRSRPCR